MYYMRIKRKLLSISHIDINRGSAIVPNPPMVKWLNVRCHLLGSLLYPIVRSSASILVICDLSILVSTIVHCLTSAPLVCSRFELLGCSGRCPTSAGGWRVGDWTRQHALHLADPRHAVFPGGPRALGHPAHSRRSGRPGLHVGGL